MITIRTEGLEEFIDKLEKAGGGAFHKEATLWLQAMGLEFLDIVQDQIISDEVVNTRRLFNSFRKGDREGFWKLKKGGITLTLEVWTKLEYASIINDGYPTVTENSASRTLKDGTLVRWVPGVWEGDEFRYIKGSDEGMLLKERFIPGRPYYDDAEALFELMFNQSLERKLQQWLDKFFG